MRSRFFRFRDRASYRTSEVLALFVIGLFGGALFFGFLVVMDFVFRKLFGESA
jgi:hypothetical protein